jgi:hypothetical protein
MVTSPLVWLLTWTPARCIRSIQEVVLCRGDVAVIRRLDTGVRNAERHCPLRENDPSQVCSEVAPSRIHSSPKPGAIIPSNTSSMAS